MAFVLVERSKNGKGSVFVPERLVTAIAYCDDHGMDSTIVEYFDEDGEFVSAKVAGKPYFIGRPE